MFNTVGVRKVWSEAWDGFEGPFPFSHVEEACTLRGRNIQNPVSTPLLEVQLEAH